MQSVDTGGLESLVATHDVPDGLQDPDHLLQAEPGFFVCELRPGKSGPGQDAIQGFGSVHIPEISQRRQNDADAVVALVLVVV
jgi:hypothetical protein